MGQVLGGHSSAVLKAFGMLCYLNTNSFSSYNNKSKKILEIRCQYTLFMSVTIKNFQHNEGLKLTGMG